MSTSDNQPPPQGSVLDKYFNQQPKSPNAEPQPTITECYTEMPTHVAMLNLVDSIGNHTAFPYHAIEQICFNTSGSITIKFHSQEITLKGQNLDPIYFGLVRHKVSRLESMPRGNFHDGRDPSIISISIYSLSD